MNYSHLRSASKLANRLSKSRHTACLTPFSSIFDYNNPCAKEFRELNPSPPPTSSKQDQSEVKSSSSRSSVSWRFFSRSPRRGKRFASLPDSIRERRVARCIRHTLAGGCTRRKRWTSWVVGLWKRGRGGARIAPGLFSLLFSSRSSSPSPTYHHLLLLLLLLQLQQGPTLYALFVRVSRAPFSAPPPPFRDPFIFTFQYPTFHSRFSLFLVLG